jgi:hypothetical protein
MQRDYRAGTVMGSVRAVIIGVAVFFLLQICTSYTASYLDGALFINVGESMREILVLHRVWELYRTALYFLAAAAAALVVARVDRARFATAVPLFALVLLTILLVSLIADSRGYYLTDIAEIFVIAIGALVGGLLYGILGGAARGGTATP